MTVYSQLVCSIYVIFAGLNKFLVSGLLTSLVVIVSPLRLTMSRLVSDIPNIPYLPAMLILHPPYRRLSKKLSVQPEFL
jgi:hypothetical protein